MGQLIAGAVVAILSTWFGSWLTGKQASRLEAERAAADEHRRAREALAAARIVWYELGAAAISVESAHRDGNLTALKGIPRGAWTAYGAMLTSELPPDVIDPLAEVWARLGSAAQLVADVGLLPLDAQAKNDAKENLGGIARQARDAQDTLARWINSQPARLQ